MLLLEVGHPPAYATSGRGARAGEEAAPEFVFLDIGHPDLDGSEVATKLRRTPGCEQSLIIASPDAGCDAYYVKPLEPKLIEAFLSR